MPGLALQVVRLGPDDGPVFRAVRLAALTDAPWAFGSALATESSLDEDAWRRRLAGRAQFVVQDGSSGVVLGTVGLIPSDEVEGAGELISMWVAPEARGRGAGDLLVDAAVQAARERGHTEVRLWVADGNDRAAALYRRRGFEATGASQPVHPDDPHRLEHGMRRPIRDVTQVDSTP